MVNGMNPEQQFLQNLYEAFNKREIEAVISSMHPNVKWANGMEGGFVYGRDQVRDYWEKQFEMVQPKLQALNFETDKDNRSIVTVHQLVRDLEGNLLLDQTVQQIFTIENGLISTFEIGDAEPFLKNEN
jgi:SnoaL-like domain